MTELGFEISSPFPKPCKSTVRHSQPRQAKGFQMIAVPQTWGRCEVNALELGPWIKWGQFPTNLTGTRMQRVTVVRNGVGLVWFKLCSSLTRKKISCLRVYAFAPEYKGKLFLQPRQAKGFRIIAIPSHIWATCQAALPKVIGFS